mmetsp:Transcript_55176/g.121024  ORF Transcript_55176/g.121024 Transcript_55176/m.121024 type:complete len:242 (+) Transcript_55176:42-767(+)|eukprot:CAMPEP_0180418916 /NCGR_PEP_ID=MMETSP1036_2-20121128/1816_1 /TAXON_ID=632150 /ORGANISM="Azadinium spinosum, Strain 3D9" /LENGTH=241 /DNA_ID=CAMNT_0022424033 /DNA_START=41 /DNA_END=766 /DNA_ORIENTATION=+
MTPLCALLLPAVIFAGVQGRRQQFTLATDATATLRPKQSCPVDSPKPSWSVTDGGARSQMLMGVETKLTSRVAKLGNWSQAEVEWPTGTYVPASVELNWITTSCKRKGLCDCTFKTALAAAEQELGADGPAAVRQLTLEFAAYPPVGACVCYVRAAVALGFSKLLIERGESKRMTEFVSATDWKPDSLADGGAAIKDWCNAQEAVGNLGLGDFWTFSFRSQDAPSASATAAEDSQCSNMAQ